MKSTSYVRDRVIVGGYGSAPAMAVARLIKLLGKIGIKHWDGMRSVIKSIDWKDAPQAASRIAQDDSK